MSEPKAFVNNRIVGGCSLHASHDPSKCTRDQYGGQRCPEPRCVDCCGVVDEHDIIECPRCGKQWTVPCYFDEECS